MDIKGVLCSSGEEIQTQNYLIYNFNEVIIQTQAYFIIQGNYITFHYNIPF